MRCSFVDSVASPQSNMGFCVHSAVFLLYRWSNRWRVVERHKEAKTHSLSSSQLATRSKRFSQACAQTCAVSNILDFISFLFYPYVFCLGCVLSRFGSVHTVFVYCFFTHNGPHREISPAWNKLQSNGHSNTLSAPEVVISGAFSVCLLTPDTHMLPLTLLHEQTSMCCDFSKGCWTLIRPSS